jgi:putative DNA-invertase from lambdoid prophage Rac
MLPSGAVIGSIAKATGLSRQTVYRIQAEPAWADALLERWAIIERARAA